MARRKALPELSKSELDIIKVLWQVGRQSAREVHDALAPTYGWAYSTTKTMMDRMVGKGYLKRENFHGVFLYEPLISRPHGLAKLVQDFADNVLEMDAGSLVSLFARNKKLTPAEIAELKQILEQQNKKGR